MYEVLALKYGERDTTACQFFYRESSHEKITLDYFVWLITGGPYPVLVDTGFQEDDAQSRGIRNYVRPSEMVERAGVKVADIPVALISHLHYDHWAGHRLFPASEFWIQQDEIAFWTGRYGRYEAFSASQNVGALANLTTLNYAKRIRVIEGEREVLPGIRVHRVGGHTAGLQIVTRGDGARPGRADLGCLALLPQRGALPAGADHHEPARDAGRVRHHPCAGGVREAHRGRPRSSSVRALQAGGAGHHQDRVRGSIAVGERQAAPMRNRAGHCCPLAEAWREGERLTRHHSPRGKE